MTKCGKVTEENKKAIENQCQGKPWSMHNSEEHIQGKFQEAVVKYNRITQ